MVVIDQKFIFQEVEEKSLKFLRERGHINPTRVNFIDFSNLYFGSGFKSGEEINQFEVEGMRFEQVYGVIENGNCIYMTILVPYFTELNKTKTKI